MRPHAHWAVYLLGIVMSVMVFGFIGLIILSDAKRAHDDRTLAWTYVDAHGTAAFEQQFEDAHPFSDGLARVRTDNGWGAIDRSGELVIPDRFDELDACVERQCSAARDRRWGILDATGAWMVEPVHHRIGRRAHGLWPVAISLGVRSAGASGGVAVVEESWGLMRPDGSWVREPARRLDSPERWLRISAGDDGWAVTTHDEQGGFVDATGHPLLGKWRETRPFFEGRAAVGDGVRWGVIDETGAELVGMRFGLRGQGYVDGRIAMHTAEGGVFIDRDGYVVAKGFERVDPFSEGLAAVRIDGRAGFVDRDGQWVIEPVLEGVAEPFREGAAVIRLPGLLNRWGFVFLDGRILEGFADARSFSEGLAPVRVPRPEPKSL